MTKELWHDKDGYETIYLSTDELTSDMQKELDSYQVGCYFKGTQPYAYQYRLSKQQLKRCPIMRQKVKNFKVIS